MVRTYVRKRPAHCLIEDVHELCRLCLQRSDQWMTIYKNDAAVCPLALRIRMCVGLDIRKEAYLSNIVCIQCYEQIEKYYEFRKKCEFTYLKLKSHMTALKENGLLNYQKNEKYEKFDFFDDESNGNELEENFGGCLRIDCQENSVEAKEAAADCIQINNCVPDEKPNDQNLVEQQQIQPVSNALQVPVDGESKFSSFLVDLLIKLGILVLQDGSLTLVEGESNVIHLELGDGTNMTLQLGEEKQEPAELMPSTDEVKNEGITNEELYQSEEDVLEKYIIMDPTATSEVVAKENGSVVRGSKRPGAAECPKCGKWFSSRSILKRHARVHSGERPYPCDTCGRRFQTSAVLARHKFVHSEQRPFPCLQCRKSFTQRGALATHAAHAHHAPRTLHACTRCHKMFMHRSGLTRHTATHTKPRLLCAQCGGNFHDRCSLLRHLRKTCSGRAGNSAPDAGNPGTGS